ncbi:phage tail tape measure protein [Chromobacterium haemolyticum]|uniref:Phage tail tape measure protein n=1 Tax=Chromobacterium fluminis TaxID=3044269 RepID=A0ABX0L8H1_9NEIS|nr:phage tail tape measure protein [Chromobacterium haemolyticum]NHR08005.1 phage tail tape measure protein [Chromobacterium haemolyticum]
MSDKFQLKALITGVDKLSPMLDGMRGRIASFRKSLRKSGMGDINLMGAAAFAAPLVGAAKSAIDFESAMADVKKVVDFDTPQQFAEMSKDVVEMSKRLPMAAKDIAAIVAAGGQSGIEKSALKQFAEDAVKMGVAFDLSASESGEMMAKWRTSFKMNQKEVATLADKINYLGNTGPANAKKISDVVTKIGPLGSIAGVAAGEIAALGATMVGTGVEQDVAATGIKNFMLALTAGKSATTSQKKMFKALRLDAKQFAVDMQTDAKGAITRVLTAIGKVDKSKQSAVLAELFGKESISAIAPLLTNLDLLKTNFTRVADSSQYAGSMQKEYEARAATTANNLQIMSNKVQAVAMAVGNVLLPPLNQFLEYLGPIVEGVQAFAQANPDVIKGAIGAAGAVVALKLGVMALTAGLSIMNVVMAMSPLGLFVRGAALLAGYLIANWSKVGPWFAQLWTGIKSFFAAGLGFVKSYLGWTPLGLVLNNWEPLRAFFAALWEGLKVVFAIGMEWLKAVFLDYSPLGLIVKNWGPIVEWFKGMWEKIKPFIDPILSGAAAISGGISGAIGGAINSSTNIIKGATDAAKADLNININGAPAGTRVDAPKTENARVNVKQNAGVRSLAAAKG